MQQSKLLESRIADQSASSVQSNDRSTQQNSGEPTQQVEPSAKVDSAQTSTGEKAENVIEKRKLEQEQRIVSELAARDREVRAHEQAHAAIGGPYAGAPQYTFERGPDGVSYAVGGEVSIDVSEAATPGQTIQKMQVVRRAALAPAEPSSQDRKVAAKAASIEARARQELNVEAPEENSAQNSEESTQAENTESTAAAQAGTTNAQNSGVRAGSFPGQVDSYSQVLIAGQQGASSLGGLISSRA